MKLRLRKIKVTDIKAGDNLLVLRSSRYNSATKTIEFMEEPAILEASPDGDANGVYQPVQVV
jgi:hypothetical protein